ncbi:hypothetical protein NPS70_12105 [Streptomyces sp. C10-9-1]|uniref:hypothetical protein n=1 Tax=Streptomyces sp. C10-9-1 TaxID=1859285 RepID=UPI00211348DD|nr:hypothetical protein [Streptomyces sp. C10-9-1]MCQ6553934.1 hypothetical protein [Streptomyces sp. C10-9-1]
MTCEIRFTLADPDDGLPAEAVWDGYRGRPEAPSAGEAVPCSLWVDGFEDRGTSAAAFEEAFGRDTTPPGCARTPPAPPPRRAHRVPEASGPVPWPVELPAYRAAAAVAALRPAVFRGLPDGYHAVYGGLDPAAAPEPSRRSASPGHRAPAGTAPVLAAGHANHHRAPHAWTDEPAPARTEAGPGPVGAGGVLRRPWRRSR